MASNRTKKRLAYALVASVAMGTTLVRAAETVKQGSAAPAPVKVAVVNAPIDASIVQAKPGTVFPPLQAGVRKAAAQGPNELRRYVYRTQAIYGYSQLPPAEPVA